MFTGFEGTLSLQGQR